GERGRRRRGNDLGEPAGELLTVVVVAPQPGALHVGGYGVDPAQIAVGVLEQRLQYRADALRGAEVVLGPDQGVDLAIASLEVAKQDLLAEQARCARHQD